MPADNVDVLLVDDRTDLTTLFGNYLSMLHGYTIERVSSSRQGQEMISGRSYALIISNDTSREGMRLEALASSLDIPVIHLKNERKNSRSSHFTLHPGDSIVVEDSHQRMEFPLQNSAGLQALFRDIARTLQQLMKNSQARKNFDATFGHPYDVICSAPVSLCILEYPDISWMNEEMAHYLGYAPSSLVNQSFSSLLTMDGDRKWFHELYRQKRHTTDWSQRDVVLRKRDGTPLPSRVKFRRLAQKDGKVRHICVCEDIRCQQSLLEVKNTCEERIEEIEGRYRDVLENLGAIVIRTDTEGNISFCNHSAETTFNCDSSELVGRNVVGTLVNPGTRSARDFITMLNDCSGNADEYSLIAVDHPLPGSRHVCIAWKMVGIQKEGHLSDIVCVGEDITDYSRQDSGRIRTDSWRSRLLKGTDIGKEVFDDVFHICVEISREGREGKKVGTSFLVGDASAVMARSRPLIINSFDAQERDWRYVGYPENRECIKNFAMLDGGFVIRGDGFIEASGRQFLPGDVTVHLPPGYGTRHRSVAAMTRVTRGGGYCRIRDGGTFDCFQGGKHHKIAHLLKNGREARPRSRRRGKNAFLHFPMI